MKMKKKNWNRMEMGNELDGLEDLGIHLKRHTHEKTSCRDLNVERNNRESN